MRSTLLSLILVACGKVPDTTVDDEAMQKVVETPAQQAQPAEPSGRPGPEPHEPSPPPRPGLGVTSISVAASAQADAVIYTLTCVDCVLPDETIVKGAVTATVRAYSSGNGGNASPLYDAQGRMGQMNVLASTVSGGIVWTLYTNEENALLVGGVVPGGGIVSAAVSSVSGLRQTPNTSFGTLVRSGMAAPAADGGAQFLLDSTEGLAVVTVTKDGALSKSVLAPPEADVGVFSVSGDRTAVAYDVQKEGGLDSTVNVNVGGGVDPVTSSIVGVPAALWTEGDAFKVVIKRADGTAALWDGTNTVELPRSDEAACTAVAFSSVGELAMLSAGPQSAVLYVVQNGVLSAPRVLSVRDQAGPATGACAAAFGQAYLHVAWAEERTYIQHQLVDIKTGKTELRTRHDTVKNSIGNIR